MQGSLLISLASLRTWKWNRPTLTKAHRLLSGNTILFIMAGTGELFYFI